MATFFGGEVTWDLGLGTSCEPALMWVCSGDGYHREVGSLLLRYVGGFRFILLSCFLTRFARHKLVLHQQMYDEVCATIGLKIKLPFDLIMNHDYRK